MNAKVATEFATVPVYEWKPLIDLDYKKVEGTLVEIKDQNGLDLADCFKKKTIAKSNVNYIVYYFKIKNCLKNFKITFKFEA